MGVAHPDHLLAALSAPQVAEWLAYLRIEGMDTAERQDFRAGQICATVANYAGKVLKEGRTSKPSDFFPALDVDRSNAKPILLKDPEAQSQLIMARIFGTTHAQAYGKH